MNRFQPEAAEIHLNFGTTPPDSPRTSSDFEEIQYPHTTSSTAHHNAAWTAPSHREEDLPLYSSMNEEKARRRVPRASAGSAAFSAYVDGPDEYDDEGKDVYAKMRASKMPLGSGRPRRPPPPPATTIGEFVQQNLEHIPPIIYTLLSCWTRFHRIGHSPIVVWDEAHFGKFGSHYLKREFYFDVHPPLGKMLVGLAGLLSGYDGSFEFKSGETYPDTVPYVAMRVMMAMFGVGMVPLSWYTAVELGIKWVGAFVTALVGLYTIEDLWDKFGDLKMSVRDQCRHWGARIGCLIVLPILVYMASFKIHFLVLNHSGPGDAQMSSLFQANLVGNNFASSPLEIAFGSKITLKNMGYGGGLLHSHVQTFPVGSNQQQVTCYHYKDDNNDWVILPRWDEPAYNPNNPIRFLQDGDIVRLSHASTTRNLHSHPVPAPVTKLHNEVACYGNATVGDSQDYWKVEVVDDMKQGKKANVKRIHSLTTRLRFRHLALGCYLRAANSILPQWGFKQVEVTCDKENNPTDTHTYWNVENHWNDRLPAGDARFYKSPFFRDFWHLNIAMATSNNALIPDPDKEDILASKPFDWPFLRLGLRMCGWGDGQTKYYLLGTPVIWWGSTISLVLALGSLGIYLMRMQRKNVDMEPREWDHYLYVGKIAFFGWFLHYLPFLIMGRVTYLHHYLPTLYFAVLMLAHMIDHFIFSSRRLSDKTKWIVFGVCCFTIFSCFWWFRGVAFGIDGPISEHWGLQWRKSWNIYQN
ncbi:hypothetical protein EIP86_004310 [Pleurotus ostreatoroseus]|nr:hypothetical protein EIP86_004310 [Pleurotus ostreatoroseus]